MHEPQDLFLPASLQLLVGPALMLVLPSKMGTPPFKQKEEVRGQFMSSKKERKNMKHSQRGPGRLLSHFYFIYSLSPSRIRTLLLSTVA